MANAVVAVFDEYNEAQSTVNELLVAGFNKNEVRLTSEEEEDGRAPRQEQPRGKGIKGFFQSLFGFEQKEDDARIYDEAVRHGNYVVTAIAETAEKSEIASEVMSHHHPVDLEERSAAWFSGKQEQEAEEVRPDQSLEGSRVIPVIEEDVQIGKREVQRGGVRIYQQISEIPVEEDLLLREERVVVDRVAVDQPATEEDLRSFKEGTQEVRETSEEAVISKKARVVEEVRVGKEVSERMEKVRQTARKSNVQVERTGAEQYRSHWQQNYANQGGRYEDYEPAYRYGSTASSSQLYRGRPWDEIEPELRSDWEARNPNSGWERFKESIKHAFSGRK